VVEFVRKATPLVTSYRPSSRLRPNRHRHRRRRGRHRRCASRDCAPKARSHVRIVSVLPRWRKAREEIDDGEHAPNRVARDRRVASSRTVRSSHARSICCHRQRPVCSNLRNCAGRRPVGCNKARVILIGSGPGSRLPACQGVTGSNPHSEWYRVGTVLIFTCRGAPFRYKTGRAKTGRSCA
jgi:hypothetical protein